ncbi:MAG UNVERIFIED_CONTAM: hypothetical protein LVR18_36445 [Planctomycetaceae bacterium]
MSHAAEARPAATGNITLFARPNDAPSSPRMKLLTRPRTRRHHSHAQPSNRRQRQSHRTQTTHTQPLTTTNRR